MTFKEAWKVFKKREKFKENKDNFNRHIPGEPKIVWTMSISAYKRACQFYFAKIDADQDGQIN